MKRINQPNRKLPTQRWVELKQRLLAKAEGCVLEGLPPGPQRARMLALLEVLHGEFWLGNWVGGAYEGLACKLRCSVSSIKRAINGLIEANLLNRTWVLRGDRAYDGHAAGNQHMEYSLGDLLSPLVATAPPAPVQSAKPQKPRAFRAVKLAAPSVQGGRRSHNDPTMGGAPFQGAPPIGANLVTSAPPHRTGEAGRRREKISRLEALARIASAKMRPEQKGEFVTLMTQVKGSVLPSRLIQIARQLQKEQERNRARREGSPLQLLARTIGLAKARPRADHKQLGLAC